jgi:hypothetical protein
MITIVCVLLHYKDPVPFVWGRDFYLTELLTGININIIIITL